MAVTVYLVLTYLVPALAKDNKLLSVMAAALATHAWMPSSLFVVIAPMAYFHQRQRKRLLEQASCLDSIRQMSWQAFELLVGEVYRRQGYTVIENGGGGADGGVDLVLKKPGETIVVQCKRWKTNMVGVTSIRELYGVAASLHATGAIFVTSGEYTEDALRFARGMNYDLVNGAKLIEMVKGLQVENQYPLQLSTNELPSCPICDSLMVLRVGKKGARAGQKFYGCSKYPQCRGTIPV